LNLNKIVQDLKEERGRVDRAIAALGGSVSPTMVAKKRIISTERPVITPKGKKRGGITPEGRKQLSLAMKRRWADRRKKGL
jgi:hypothetical protein